MSKLSKEEILRMVEDMADGDGVDIEQLYTSAKAKLEGMPQKNLQVNDDTMTAHFHMHGNNSEHSLKNLNKGITKEQLEDFLEDEGNRQMIDKRLNAMTDAEREFLKDTEMTPIPSSYGRPSFGIPTGESMNKQRIDMHNSVEKMDMFAGNKSSTRKENPEEVQSLITKLKELGIRDGNYARVKLGLMSYGEYLTSRPELLRFKRFKSVLNKAIGYKSVYGGTGIISRVVTLQSLFYKAYNNNEFWEEWFNTIDKRLPQPLSHRTTTVGYLDNAVTFVLDYAKEKYAEIIHKMGIAEREEILLTGLILGMLDFGYNANQILFALIRPVEAKRNWKMKQVREYYKFDVDPDAYNEICVGIIKDLHALNLKEHNIELLNLEHLVTQPSIELLDLTHESLMIANADEVKQIIRKDRIIGQVRCIAGRLSWGDEVDEDIKKRFDKNLIAFVEYFAAEYKEECDNIMSASSNKAYNIVVENINAILSKSDFKKDESRGMAHNANEQLPDVKRLHEQFEKGGSRVNWGEIGQICYDFRFGRPEY